MIQHGIIFRWLLDVQDLWPTTTHHPTPLEEPEPFKSTDRWATTSTAAQQGLALCSPAEQRKVLKYYRRSDAKLSLGSCLLKRAAVARGVGIPWVDVRIGVEDEGNGKPCYLPPSGADAVVVGGGGSSARRWGRRRPIEFNVSHHGTLVALVGYCYGGGSGGVGGNDDGDEEEEEEEEESVKLGVDIVRMSWERDCAKVREGGFEAWAATYEMVFSDREVRDIAEYVPPPRRPPQTGGRQEGREEEEEEEEEEEIRAKLRHFYAHWCMKEAYVKMTGEALMASWLKALEFRNVQVPAPAVEGDWGESCRDAEIWFHGERVLDVRLEIQAYKDDYMVATCSSNLQTGLGAFHVCNLENDIYPKT